MSDEPRICKREGCGKVVPPKSLDTGGNKKIYCSPFCKRRVDYSRKKALRATHGMEKKHDGPRICKRPGCGEVVLRKGGPPKFYCSRKCKRKQQICEQSAAAKRLRESEFGKDSDVCKREGCAKPLPPRKERQRGRTRHYCSQKCYKQSDRCRILCKNREIRLRLARQQLRLMTDLFNLKEMLRGSNPDRENPAPRDV